MGYIYDMQLTGSNVEQTIGGALPAKANLIGISDGTNIRAMLGNTAGTLLASAARVSGTWAPNQINNNARGIVVFLNVTAASGTGGLQPAIYGVDPVSSAVAQLNADPSAVTAVGCYTYVFYPSSMNIPIKQASQGLLPRQWIIQVKHSDATSYTYSLGFSLIL